MSGYHAEYAKSNRSSCTEFRCRRGIDKGTLRIGLYYGEGRVNWYHPECLCKTFYYKNTANAKITSLDDMTGTDSLKPEDVQVLQALIDKHTRKKKKSKENEDGPKTKKPKTTPFIEQLKADYQAALLEKQNQEQEPPELEDGETTGDKASMPVLGEEEKKADDAAQDSLRETALSLYGQCHKMKLPELQDYLRWNRQILKGTKAIVLHKVLDGTLHGRYTIFDIFVGT